MCRYLSIFQRNGSREFRRANDLRVALKPIRFILAGQIVSRSTVLVVRTEILPRIVVVAVQRSLQYPRCGSRCYRRFERYENHLVDLCVETKNRRKKKNKKFSIEMVFIFSLWRAVHLACVSFDCFHRDLFISFISIHSHERLYRY